MKCSMTGDGIKAIESLQVEQAIAIGVENSVYGIGMARVSTQTARSFAFGLLELADEIDAKHGVTPPDDDEGFEQLALASLDNIRAAQTAASSDQ